MANQPLRVYALYVVQKCSGLEKLDRYSVIQMDKGWHFSRSASPIVYHTSQAFVGCWTIWTFVQAFRITCPAYTRYLTKVKAFSVALEYDGQEDLRRETEYNRVVFDEQVVDD